MQAFLGFIGGILLAFLASWLAGRRWSQTTAHDGSRHHLVWRYQKQLSCYREFFELWQELTTDTEYVDRIEKTYEALAERQQSAERHAMRLTAPLLAEFGFIFGGTLAMQAAELLQAAARSRLTSDSTDGPNSLIPPKKEDLDASLREFQSGVISTITMTEELLDVPPRISPDPVPTVAVGKGFAFTINRTRQISPHPEPLPVPAASFRPSLPTARRIVEQRKRR